METTCDLPLLVVPDFVSVVRELAQTTRQVANSILSRVREKKQVKIAAVRFLEGLDNFSQFIPQIIDYLSDLKQKDLQQGLVLCTGLRTACQMADESIYLLREKPVLNSRQLKRLKAIRNSLRNAVQEADEKVLSLIELPNCTLELKHTIDGHELMVPLRVFIEDDDTGKHISCVELPMLYGFGETEDEAMSMLDREILSLREDAKAFDLPDEYKYAAMLVKLAMRHEE